ncbi:hypothetical protein Hdeb2414_s0007g00259911 [Helianthus debilis subsp. tardiflorus]
MGLEYFCSIGVVIQPSSSCWQGTCTHSILNQRWNKDLGGPKLDFSKKDMWSMHITNDRACASCGPDRRVRNFRTKPG